MATSLAFRTLQIFSGSGLIAIAPLAIQFMHKEAKINTRGDTRLVSGDEKGIPEKSQEKIADSAEAVLKEAVKRLKEEGDQDNATGCFWLPNKYNSLDLFMCVNIKTLKPVTLFHYDWKNRNKPLNERLNEVSEIIYHSSSDIRVKFKNNNLEKISRHLTSSFAWLRGWEGSMIPKKHCSIMPEEGDNSNWYKLTCEKESKSGRLNDVVNPELVNSQESKLKIH